MLLALSWCKSSNTISNLERNAGACPLAKVKFMIKNGMEGQKDAMVVLAAHYLKDVMENKSSRNINIGNEPFCLEINKILDSLAALADNPLSQKLLNNACDEISLFVSSRSFYEYKKQVVSNFKFIAVDKENIPALMILDYFYTKDMGFVQGVDYSGDEPQAVSIPLAWPDYLLLCYYIGKKDEKGKNGVSEYVAKQTDIKTLSSMSVQDYIDILMESLIMYRSSLASKVSLLQNKKMQSNFQDFARVISNSYDVKLAITQVLSNFISDIARTGKLLPSNDILGVPDFKMGGLVFKNVKLTILEDGCRELSYMVNAVERSIFIHPDVPWTIVNYSVYTDLIALALALRHTSTFEQTEVAQIVQKYNLLYFRSVDLEPDIYSDFLSLFE